MNRRQNTGGLVFALVLTAGFVHIQSDGQVAIAFVFGGGYLCM